MLIFKLLKSTVNDIQIFLHVIFKLDTIIIKFTVKIKEILCAVVYKLECIFISFQHIVFSLKFLIAYLIPDTPPSVALAIRKVRQ